VRKSIERMLRQQRHTLDEILGQIRREFGAQLAPSRSALHRYGARFEDMMARTREIQAAAEVLVTELGEDVGDKAGALLAQAVTTLATDAAMRAQGAELSVEEVGQMARAARAVLETRRMSVAERQALRKAAREELIEEGKARLDALGKSRQIDPQILAAVVQAAYGLEAA
jgi:hypothetical protein